MDYFLAAKNNPYLFKVDLFLEIHQYDKFRTVLQFVKF